MIQAQAQETDQNLDRMKRYIDKLGVLALSHTKRTYWDHLDVIYRELRSWGCDEAVCNAGVFHSIYGTDQFLAFKFPLSRRFELQALIGKRAEQIVFLNCFMDRAVFDADLVSGRLPHRIHHRVEHIDIELSPRTFDDLCRVHLCDWLESVARIGNWEYRGDAYLRLAIRLKGPAKAAYERELSRDQTTATPPG